MRKTKEICRLSAAGLPGRAIARALGASSSTVGDAIARLKAAGLDWSRVETMSEEKLERLLYREQGQMIEDAHEPNWSRACSELKRRHMTLQLLWFEYRAEHPSGYSRLVVTSTEPASYLSARNWNMSGAPGPSGR